ncbi:MAG: FYDLN acid domain-containing protein [Myxococcota bacterium]
MDQKRKAKLGQRWICYSCQARFYDLKRPEPICPRCGANQREAPGPDKPRRGARAAEPERPEAAASTSNAAPESRAAEATSGRATRGRKRASRLSAPPARSRAAREPPAEEIEDLDEGVPIEDVALDDIELVGDTHIVSADPD